MSAATVVAAFGLGGCRGEAPPAATSSPTVTTITSVPTVPPPAALPPPEALTDVLYRLTDTAVPGADKVGLVEQAGPADAQAIDQFGRALADNGFAPPNFEARDLAWSDAHPDNVVATVVVKRADSTPDAPARGGFTFPMEFTPHDGGWQLSRDTADQLLELGAPTPSASSASSASSAPAPAPAPASPPAPAQPTP